LARETYRAFDDWDKYLILCVFIVLNVQKKHMKYNPGGKLGSFWLEGNSGWRCQARL
jgi:hypothetical protein